MPVNLVIENVPDEVVARLNERARLNRRCLQDELLALIGATEPPARGPLWVYNEVKKLGRRTEDDSVDIIRAHRDGRGL